MMKFKKLLSMALVCAMISSISIPILAAEITPSSSIEYRVGMESPRPYEGSGTVIYNKIIEINNDNIITECLVKKDSNTVTYADGRALEKTTYEKSVTESFDTGDQTVTLTATFSYDKSAKTVSCVSKYEKYSTSRLFETTSLTASPSGTSSGPVTVTLKYKKLAFSPSNRTLTIKCTNTGNVS